MKEIILFSIDMISYFLKKYNVEGTLSILLRRCDGYPKKFTETMGALARHLALTKMGAGKHWNEDNPFYLERDFIFMKKFTMAYYPENFLYSCGLMGLSMIWHYRNGAYYYADRLFLTINFCLSEAIRDGSFFASGGWNTLKRYANATLREINKRSLAERVLFAKDMVRYFMERSQVQWTPHTNNDLDGHRRRFTEVIGSTAWWLEKCPMASSRITRHKKRPIISTAYHPRDLLEYCGIVAMSSVRNFLNGNYEYPNAAVLDIVSYLGEIHENDYFHLSGGWDGVTHFACKHQVYLMRDHFPYLMQYWQTDITLEMQEADEVDETLREQQCIGTLLHNL